MKEMNIVGVLAAIVVGVIMLGALLAPTISNYGEEDAVAYNSGPRFALVDEDEHVIVVGAGADGFEIKTDGVAAETPAMATYNPGGAGSAEYLALGVYEAYNLDGVLVSQAGRTPTASQNIDVFRAQALAGNADNRNGTYQLWNWYQYTLYKEMATAIMGSMDSQHMMGPGKTAGSGPNETGLTAAAYEKGANSSESVSLLLENAWGSLWEFVGDTETTDYVLRAGNTLGGRSVVGDDVRSALGGVYAVPQLAGGNAWISSVNDAAEVWGLPSGTAEAASAAGAGVTDKVWANPGNRLVHAGGYWNAGSAAGLSAFHSNDALGCAYQSFGGRLAYLTDAGAASASAVGGAKNFGYVVSFDGSDGTVSDVQALVDGSLVSVMPTGTELNPYWSFGADGVGPFGTYYAAINLADGANADDSVQARLSTEKGAVAYILDPSDLARTLAGNPFDATLYNVMLMIPMVYSYSDSSGKLYLGSAADTFDGVTMTAYGHTYTVDVDVDTGNPAVTSSASLAIGEESVLRLYSTGDLVVIGASGTVSLGQVSEGNPVSVTVAGDVLRYTAAGGAAGTSAGMRAYIASDGEMAMSSNPYVVEDSDVILGGYAHDLATTTGDTVSVGYTYAGKVSDPVADAVLAPVSAGGNAAVSTEADPELSSVRTDLLRVDGILFTTEWSDGGESVATYSYFLAPYEVVYSNPEYIGGSNATLLGAVVVIAVVAILMMAVGAIRTGRD